METVFTLARHSKITRFFILATALAVLVGLLIGVPVSAAHAEANPPVTITPLSPATVSYKNKYILIPRYSKTYTVEHSTATVTVTQGNKLIASHVDSVELYAGTYTVTQTVTYSGYAYQSRQVETVAVGTWIQPYPIGPANPGCKITSKTSVTDTTGTWTGACDVPPYWGETVKVEGTWQLADGNIHLLNSVGEEAYSYPSDLDYRWLQFDSHAKLQALTNLTKWVTDKVDQSGTVTSTQTLTITEGPKNCATRADYKKVKATKKRHRGDSIKKVAKRLFSPGEVYLSKVIGGHTIEVRIYEMCSGPKVIAVGFGDGHAIKKAMGNR